MTDNETQTGRGFTFTRNLFSSPAQIWKSRLSWRITLAVFLTIMAVHASVLSITIGQFERSRLDELKRVARSAIVPLVSSEVGDSLAPLSVDAGRKLVDSTIVDGFVIYSKDFQVVRLEGDAAVTVLKPESNLSQTYRSPGGDAYEVIFRQRDIGRPFLIVARLDASSVKAQVMDHIQQSLLIMLLMSALVTTVLMMALGRWLLEPILFMRDNLLAASANPESPNIPNSPFPASDEIGGAIEVAQKLIRQNAENIKRIKNAAQDQIHKLAYYDTLTGLPNRSLFVQKIAEQAKATSGDTSTQRFAVIAVDLDHFKDINDSVGHNIGDAILRAVGRRLRSALPESAVVARTGEDEFAITMPLNTDVSTARALGEKVQSVIRSEPFKVFNESFQVRSSIGVATYPDDGVDPDQVLKNADIALNRAKEDGRDTLREYLEDFDRAVQMRFQMLRDLRDALERGQLSLHYQPQLDLTNGTVIGAEALLRWWKPDNSKEGGVFIPPSQFVPIAEQSGLIVPIGEWVMRKACETARTWHEAGYPIRIAVNVSAAQFHQSDIVAFTEAVLKETGLDPHHLELEVTESVFMDDIHHTIQTLQHLHALGVELAIDDFGTGYSSLSYLRQFPIDRLKIDQSFIRNALNNADDASIARTIVRLGHSLNLRVIAEGVETREHEEFLKSEGCDEVQGYRYSRPLPEDKAMAFLKSYSGELSFFDKAAS